MQNNYVIIMAGGSGTRFWPVSLTSKPKQFHDFLGTGKTLLQQTYDRMTKIAPHDHIYFVINEKYKDLVLEQIPQINDNQLIAEPLALNTAPCIAYASYKIHQMNPEANLFIAPSDHLIKYEDEFTRIAKLALNEATKTNALITLGIQPTHPETGFGYIQYDFSENQVKKVLKFTEKPPLNLAKSFLKEGNYLWNSGMFIWKTENIIKAFEQHCPDYHAIFSKTAIYQDLATEKEYISAHYPNLNPLSIDYAIMEKATNVYVIPSSFGWNDLGTWSAAYDELDKDDLGNAIRGKALTFNTKESLLVSNQRDKIIVAEGLDNYFVIDTNEVLLICKKENAQEVKNFSQAVNKFLNS